MHRRSMLVVATVTIVVLAACGGPTPPTPTPDLTLVGVTPTTALPGEQVTLQGTGIGDDHVVTFDGAPATIVSNTDTTLVVIVPEGTYGYPTIAIDEVSATRLLFVGTDYAGPNTLAGVQAALDDLPENAALRIGAGTFDGTDLSLDNRKLYGAGASSILDVSGELALYARNVHVTVLEGVAVEGGDVVVRRGRVSTAAVPPALGSGTVVLSDLSLDVDLFSVDGADYVSILVRDATVSATAVTTDDDSAVVYLAIEDSAFTVVTDVDFDHNGALRISGSTFDVGGQFYTYIDYISDMTFDGVDIDANDIYVYAYDSVTPFEFLVRDSTFASATSMYLGSDVADIVIEDSQLSALTSLEIDTDDDGVDLSVRRSSLTAGTYVEIDAWNYGTTYLFESVTITAGTFIDLETGGGLTMLDSTLTATAGSIDLQAYGAITVESSTLTADSYVYVYTWAGSVALRDTSLTSATSYVDVDSYDPVVVEGGSIAAATTVDVQAWYAGDVTIRNTTSIVAADALTINAGTMAYGGNNGIVTIADNASIVITNAFVVDSVYSDLVIVGNALIEAGDIDWQADASHVAIHANDRIESAANVYVYAADPGGRIGATGNLFVANAGAGTITLETQAGELTQSGNTFTGTTSFPNN